MAGWRPSLGIWRGSRAANGSQRLPVSVGMLGLKSIRSRGVLFTARSLLSARCLRKASLLAGRRISLSVDHLRRSGDIVSKAAGTAWPVCADGDAIAVLRATRRADRIVTPPSGLAFREFWSRHVAGIR